MNLRQVIENYNQSGPRYTSYPPATFFHERYDKKCLISDVKKSNNEDPQNISIYIHIPFCPQICHFCGCTTEMGFTKPFIKKYVEALIEEMRFTSSLINKERKVSQVHWGGGTPNAISMFYIEEVTDFIKGHFKFTEDYEMAIECSPAYLEFRHIEQLKNFGFNRISLGIQDFNDEVLKAVNRKPSKHPIDQVIKKIKYEGFKGTNIDLIYGLPLQNLIGFKKTIEKAIELDVDRIVTFSYAHLPSVLPRQKALNEQEFPSFQEKAKMYLEGYKKFTDKNYIAVGMDHYSKPNDELAIALKNKTLHRNFQGYCTKSNTGQVYGFGASSISQLTSSYSQNIKNAAKYINAIKKNKTAVFRGYQVTIKEKIIRDIINSIMCNYYVDFNELSCRYKTPIDELKKITNYNKNNLKDLIQKKFIEINSKRIDVKHDARLIVRNIAMRFDPMINEKKGIYSKVI